MDQREEFRKLLIQKMKDNYKQFLDKQVHDESFSVLADITLSAIDEFISDASFDRDHRKDFNVGDKVRLISPPQGGGNRSLSVGDAGTVVRVHFHASDNYSGLFGVDWGREIDGGHSCSSTSHAYEEKTDEGNDCEQGHGWNVIGSCLERVEL